MNNTGMKSHSSSCIGLVKVVFELEETDWHDHGTESLWATQIDSETFILDNIPFYAYGVSCGDAVKANRKDGELRFKEVSARAGHSTYRIFMATERFEEYWTTLERCGCSYESGGSHLLAVDVPPNADIHAVYEVLEAGRNAGVWDFEEAHCGHPL